MIDINIAIKKCKLERKFIHGFEALRFTNSIERYQISPNYDQFEIYYSLHLKNNTKS